MNYERLIFSAGLVIISLTSMFLNMSDIALLAVGAMAGMFVPQRGKK